MISVIFYGRNDNHGYNLHKRASLSLNNMAELLTNQDDEILFVDWNTSPGLPTFVESIHDLLTDKAKKITKIIKVDFHTHERLFGSKTKKQTVEPVARNVAIVRSNPANKWILSTNTDMIFVPKNSNKTLTDICNDLDDGFYELPRFSIPEILWDTFNRLNPKAVIEEIRELRTKIDLDEIITAGPILRYDAPGDFQLCLREQLFDIEGFDENMLLGWHVDSNLCRRLNMLNGETKSLEDQIYGYHCEHTKVTTHFTATSVQNSLIDFFEKIDTPYSSKKDKNWGLADVELEQFKVNEKLLDRFELLFQYAAPPTEPRKPVYANSMGELVGYPESHAIPYIVDSIYGYPEETKILFFGHNEKRYGFYKNLFERMGYSCFIDMRGSKKTKSEILNLDQPLVVVLDLGFESENQDVSITTHDDMKNNYKVEEIEVICNFLNFVIANSKNSILYKAQIISMNLETYDSGSGVFMRKCLHLPQVASNSRVRIGFLKKSLKNRNIKTLKKLLEKTRDEIQFLSSDYFKELTIESKSLDKQGFQITSHQIIPYSKKYHGCSSTRRGLMLQKSGSLEIDVKSLKLKEKSLIVFEIDRPRIDCNIYDVSGIVDINDFKKSIQFRKNESNSLAITSVADENLNKIEFGFREMNYSPDHRSLIRLANFGVFKLSKLQCKLMLMRSSDLRARYFLENNWSFSNENLRRWTTNSIFSINLNFDKINRSQCVALELNYFKNLEAKNFVKRIRNDDDKEDLEFIEIPRFTWRRGRIIYIFVPAGRHSRIIIETNSEPFEPFAMSKIENRKLHAQFGSLGIADGRSRILMLIVAFPFFIVHVKIIKVLYDMKNSFQNLFYKKMRRVLFWKI